MKYLLSIQNPSIEMTGKFDFVLTRTFWLADEEMHHGIIETQKLTSESVGSISTTAMKIQICNMFLSVKNVYVDTFPYTKQKLSLLFRYL